MDNVPTVSKEFLQDILKRPVESFTIKPGSNIGDNYMSVIYSLDVQVHSEDGDDNKIETIHLLSKCYPTHPARQEFLNKANIFWNELSVYRVLIPELNALSIKIGEEVTNFPKLIGGKAVNFEELKKLGDKSLEGKVFDSFDIYIMMTDMRHAGYKMADRQAGLSYDEMRLIVTALARLHALSRGYQLLNGLTTLREKFEFLHLLLTHEDREVWLALMQTNIENSAVAIETVLGADSEIVERTRNLKSNAEMLLDISFEGKDTKEFYKAHRVPPKYQPENEEPWKVLMHGDCWTNNLLFRFDDTSKATEAVLLDLQMMRENCPSTELAYLVYCSTTTEFRKQHMTSMLTLYCDEFTRYCNLLEVPNLPGFNLEELTRRFQRAKIFGYFLATLALPIMLKDAKDVVDMETVEGTEMVDVLKSFTTPVGHNTIFTKRIVTMAQELYDEGIL